ncbi:MAG: hypothetical protein KIT73_14480, partial [Burkholderiales bacterium]|nr:hypothetical protein [Burkholderiales bacterium]
MNPARIPLPNCRHGSSARCARFSSVFPNGTPSGEALLRIPEPIIQFNQDAEPTVAKGVTGP